MSDTPVTPLELEYIERGNVAWDHVPLDSSSTLLDQTIEAHKIKQRH